MMLLSALTRTIESEPASNRRELLIAIELHFLSRPPLLPDISEVEWLEAIVEGLGQEIAHALLRQPGRTEMKHR
jgi:hypothetical protein